MDVVRDRANVMTPQGLAEHLDHARRRVILLAALGLGALLVWWIGQSSRPAPGRLDTVAAAYQYLGGERARLETNRLLAWTNAADTDLAQLAAQVRDIGSEIYDLGGSGGQLGFVVLSDEVDHQVFALSGLQAGPRQPQPNRWSGEDLSLLVTLGSPFRATESDRAQLADAKSYLQGLTGPGFDTLRQRGMVVLDRIDASLQTLEQRPTLDPELLRSAGVLVDAAEELGVTEPDRLFEMARARAVRRDLEQGSLDVIGFSIPGSVIRLLAPLLAVAISLELLVCLRRTRRLAQEHLTSETTAAVLGSAPGWFAPQDLADGHLKRPPWFLGLLQLLAPTVAIVPLTLAGSTSSFWALAGLVLAIALQVLAMTELRKLAGTAAADPIHVADDQQRKLGVQQAKAVNGALATLWIASAAALAFFMSFVATPRDLLADHSRTMRAAATSEALNEVYNQRLREQPESFRAWCKMGCAPWTDFHFAFLVVGAEHPARPVLAALAADPVVKRQSTATARVSDLVVESRARFADLDREDAEEVIEILYRDSFDSVVQSLTKVSGLLAETPAPQIMTYLPNSVAARPTPGITPPFVMPYRQWVERAGFADLLKPLPAADEVANWRNELSNLGAARVQAVKTYADELRALDQELGKVRLKLGGVSVPRGAARDAALLVIALLAAALAARVTSLCRLAAALREGNGRPLNLDDTPGFLFGPCARKWTSFMPDFALLFGPLAVQWVVLAAPATSSLHPSVPVFSVCLTAGSLVWAIVGRRRLAHSSCVQIAR